jgi:hypothetical protein
MEELEQGNERQDQHESLEFKNSVLKIKKKKCETSLRRIGW